MTGATGAQGPCIDTARQGQLKAVVTTRNGQVFGAAVDENGVPPGQPPTVIRGFNPVGNFSLNPGETISCASVAIQGAGENFGTPVTVLTNQGRVLESLCNFSDFGLQNPMCQVSGNLTDSLPASMATSLSRSKPLTPADLRRLSASARRPAGAAPNNAAEVSGPTSVRRSQLW